MSVQSQAGGATDAKTTPAALTGPRDYGRLIVWLLFFVSGACGLIYEVLWCRQLGLIFGNTVQSLSVVLTAFMGGLALGSFSAGRLCRRLKRPLLAYGLLEVLIGVYCAVLPLLLGDTGPVVSIYRLLYAQTEGSTVAAVRFAVSFVLLLIPTTMMGATLPVLSHYLVRSRLTLGRTAGTLYALNSLGAVVGALSAGLLLLPLLGKTDTNWAAVAGNLTLGVLAIVFGARRRAAPEAWAAEPGTAGVSPARNGQTATAPKNAAETAAVPVVSALAVRCCVLTFGLTGFAAMATQIGWTRALALGTGSSTYAFSLIVAFFILGLSLGGIWGARKASRLADPLNTLAKVLLGIGLGNLALAGLLGLGPLFFFVLIAWSSQFGWPAVLAAQALGVALLILGPTFLMGATMPLTLQIASRSSVNAGRTVGNLYAVNTLGAILGSLLGGLVLLPAWHIQRTLEAMAWLYILPGLFLFCLAAGPRLRRAVVCAVALLVPLILALVFVPRWDPLVMSSGIYLLRQDACGGAIKAARELRLADAIPGVDPRLKALYYNEGAAATVAVLATSPENLTLSVEGKPDASSFGDMGTQISLTLLPELLHPSGAREVLVIGLGSGVSAGAALAPAALERVDVVEMSPEVVEASEFFHAFNGLTYIKQPRVTLQTPKLELLLNDGRNHLLLTKRKYDVIASEPSNPWMAGVGNLFTREAFQLAARCLKDDGIMCQWIHSYYLGEREFFSIVRTFKSVFTGDCQLWCSGPGDYLLLGSKRKLAIDLATLRARLAEGPVRAWLERVHLDCDTELLAGFAAGAGQLGRLSERRTVPLHTDDNMLLEFAAPRALYSGTGALSGLEFLPDPERVVRTDGLPPAERAEFLSALDLAVAARQHLWLSGNAGALRQAHLEAAAVLSPYTYWHFDYFAHREVLKAMWHGRVVVRQEPAAGDPEAARPYWERAQALLAGDHLDEALAAVEAACNADPSDAANLRLEARIWLRKGEILNTTAVLRQCLKYDPTDVAAAAQLAAVMLIVASNGRAQGAPPATITDFARGARRESRALTVLFPDLPAGWEWLCRGYLELELCDAGQREFYHQQAAAAFAVLVEKCRLDGSHVPDDLARIFALKQP